MISHAAVLRLLQYLEARADLAFWGGGFAKVLQIADNKKGPTFR